MNWIKCSEKQPFSGQLVLLKLKDTWPPIFAFYAGYDTYYSYPDRIKINQDDKEILVTDMIITHWAELIPPEAGRTGAS